MAAKGQGKFESSAGSKEGFEAWRIENLNPVKSAEALQGQLFSGDSYIFLKTNKKSSALEWDLYFWLGKDSSQDEQGGAALRTVELDDQLGGGPVQYRETEGNESARFLKLFPGNSIITKEGGVDSAFNKVDRDAYEPRLLHLTGKRTVKCKQVEKSAKSLNEGDVFILDQGKTIYQWNGKEANKYEKFKGLETVKKVNDADHGGKAETVFLDSGKNDADCAAFWNELGGSRSDIQPATPDEEHAAQKPKLIKISDESGKLLQTEVGSGKLTYDMINKDDVFIVDVVTDCYVWVGSGASKEEKRSGMKMGVEYIKSVGRQSCPIQKFVEGRESQKFKNFFKGWPLPVAAGKPADDQSAFYAKKAKAEATCQEMQEGRIVSIWRIKDMAKETLDSSVYGQFWAGDSFILLYTYKITPSKEGHIIYFWQGRDSSQDEKAASALLAKELDDEMGGDPVQVRVVMGKEPPHFLSMFQGKMIIHEGGVASGFKNVKSSDSFDTDGISLFHVRGSNSLNTRAVQVPEKAASLNSGDCFVLLTPDTMHVWRGSGANDDEKRVAEVISDIMKGERAQKLVDEGSESDAFWSALGGKGDYPKQSDTGDIERDPVLYRISCNTGSLKVEHIPDYDQSDLVFDDVMMLDVYSEVFLWVGPQASKEEKDGAMKAALNFIEKVDDGRDKDTPVYRISAGFEPPQFTQHFLGWDASKSDPDAPDPYLAELAAMGVKVEGGLVAVSSDSIGFKSPGFKAFTLEELQAKPAPAGVDPANRELYLSDADFQTHMKMDKEAWKGLAKWKRGNAKKAVKLF